MSELFDIEGKTALVTGGSRGIGLMAAQALLDAGARVIVSSRKADDCETAAAGLSELGDCEAVPANVATPEGIAELVEAVGSRFGGLDLLLNNAGTSWGAPLEDFPAGGWDKVIDTNVKAVFELTVAMLPHLRVAASERAPARVINVGSVDGIRVPAMENYSYSASKAAVHMLTRHLATRLASESVTVNAIAPGPFESKMTAFMLDDAGARSAVESTVPLGRIGTLEDIAGVIIFLAARAGSYLTGTVIPVDGGITGCG